MSSARLTRAIIPVIVAAEIVAVASGRLSLGTAAVLLVALEIVLGAVALIAILRGARNSQGTLAERLVEGLSSVMPRRIAGLVVAEFVLMRSMWLLLRGRTDVPAGATAIPYARGRVLMPAVFGALSVIELVALDVLVPWDRLGPVAWLRWAVLALSAYGVLWVVAWVAGERTHPHLVTPEHLVLRSGPWVVARIAWSNIAVAQLHSRYTRDPERLTLDAPMQPTTVDLDLAEAVVTASPIIGRRRTRQAVSLSVDEPAAALAVIDQHRLELTPRERTT